MLVGIEAGAMYVVQWSHSLRSQKFLEYYVTEDFLPTAPLSYLAEEPAAVEFLETIKRQGDSQVCLQRAMKAIAEFEAKEESSSNVDSSVTS